MKMTLGGRSAARQADTKAETADKTFKLGTSCEDRDAETPTFETARIIFGVGIIRHFHPLPSHPMSLSVQIA